MNTDNMVDFGVWLAEEYRDFVKEKGLEDEFHEWFNLRSKESDKQRNFLQSQGLENEFWEWRDKLRTEIKKNHKPCHDSYLDFMAEKGLLEVFQA